MSRIGKKPIPIPQGVKVQVGDGIVRAEGPKGKLSQPIPSPLSVKLDDGVLVIGRPDDERKIRALHGLTRALMANMVSGVKDGFERKLDIVGIGYRAQMQGKAIRLALFRSLGHIYAQLVDDDAGRTVLTADSRSKTFLEQHKTGGNVAAAKAVGALLADRAKAAGIQSVVFDRGGYKYHGRVKALADAARAGGLTF